MRIPKKTFHLNLVLVVVLVLQSKRKVSIVKWHCVSSDMIYKEISEKNYFPKTSLSPFIIYGTKCKTIW